MDFDKICMIFTMQEPYYGILLSSMERVVNNNISTIGVIKHGNIFKLEYNENFINQYDVDDILCLLKHEVLHLAFNHFMLLKEFETDSNMCKLTNIAEDMECNCYINFKNTTKLNPILPAKFGWDKQLGGREYFKLLLNQNNQDKQKEKANKPDKPCNGGQGGDGKPDDAKKSDNSNNNNDSSNDSSQNDDNDNGNNQNQNQNNDQNQSDGSSGYGGNSSDRLSESLNEASLMSFDDHSRWPDDENELQQIEQIVDDMLVLAAEEVEKSHGDIPSELKIKINILREKKPKPIADWKRYFRRYLGNEFSELIRKSKKRESRRFPDAAGNRHRRKSHILIGIDTSGSVSMPEYQEFFGQIKTLARDADFHVIECDSKIQYEYDYNGRHNEILHGGGGTSFYPVVERFIQEHRKYDALVYFTDGESQIPSNTPKETLWVISSKGIKDKNRYKVNGASVVFIPEKK